MQNERGAKWHQSPTDHLLEDDNEGGQNSSTANGSDDDGGHERFIDVAQTASGARMSGPGESTSAARLRRSCRLPRPTASVSNGQVELRRDDGTAAARRSRRLPTLQGVVINSSTYSPTRLAAGLVASIVSKCRIPAPVTTRRISSWTDGCDSQTVACPLRVHVDTTDSGEPSNAGVDGNRASDLTTTQEPNFGVRFSADVENGHVCCSCAGTGVVASHLLCIRSSRTTSEREKKSKTTSVRRASPCAAHVYRFDASLRHKVAVAEEAIETGLECLSSELRRSDAQKTTFDDRKRNGDARAAVKQVEDEPQLCATANDAIELPVQQLPDVTVLVDHPSDETGSTQNFPLPLKLDNKKPKTEPAPVSNRRIANASGTSRPNRRKPEMCGSLAEVSRLFHFTDDSDANYAIMSSQTAHDQQLASASYIVTDRRRKTATKTTEKSVALELENDARNHSTSTRLSATRTIISPKRKKTVSKAAVAVVATNSPTVSHARQQSSRRKGFGSDDVGCMNGKEKRCTPLVEDKSRTKSERKKLLSLTGSDAPVNFEFAMRRRLPLSVTFADKDEGRRSQRPARHRKPETRPPWRDLVVVVPPPLKPECNFATETVTKESFERLCGQTTDVVAASEHRSVEQSEERTTAVKERTEAKTVAKANVIESAERLYTSEDLVVRDQTTCMHCDNTMAYHVRPDGQQPARLSRAASALTPSFLIGIAPPPPSINEFHRNRPASGFQWTEATPSFIPCTASEKDFPRTVAEQKSSVDKRSVCRKTSALKDVRSTTSRSEYEHLSTSAGSFSGDNRCSPLTHQNSKQGKTSVKLRTSTPAKSVCQQNSESLRESSTTATKDKTAMLGSRVKRSSATCSIADGSLTEDVRKTTQPVEFRERSGSTLRNTPNDQSECINSRENATGRGVKCTLNQAAELLDSSQFAADSASSTSDSKETKEVNVIQSIHSTSRSDEISNQLPSDSAKQPAVAFFISCPRTGRNGSRTTAKASRIPRPQISPLNVPTRSHSYVVCAAGTWTKTQRSISAERRSSNDSPCPTFTDLRFAASHGSVSGGRLGSPLEPVVSEVLSYRVNPAGCIPDDSAALNSTESRRRCCGHPQYVDCSNSQEVWQSTRQPPSTGNDSTFVASEDVTESRRRDVDKSNYVEEKVIRLLNRASLNEPSTDEIADLTTDYPAVATAVVEAYHSQSISECAVLAATPLPHEPSGQQSPQFALASDFSISSGERNLEMLSTQPSNSRLEYSWIDPVLYVDAADCRAVEQSLFRTTSSQEYPVKAELAELDSNELKFTAARSVERTLFLDGADPAYIAYDNVHSRQKVDSSDSTKKNGQLQPNNASSNAVSTGETWNIKTKGDTDVALERCEERYQSTFREAVVSAASVPPQPSEQAPTSLQFASHSYVAIHAAETNLEGMSEEARRNQFQRTAISPVEYVDAADCETTEQFFTIYDDEGSIEIDVAKLENTALEIPATTQPARRSEASRVALSSFNSRSESAESTRKINLNIELEVRLRSFDEVSIELPDIVWSRLQSGEIRHPEAVNLCRSAFEAIVIRSAVLPTRSPSPRRQPVDGHATSSRKAKMPSRLLARAQKRRHSVKSSAELSINVVRSLIDQTVQSVSTAPRLSLPNASNWITGDDTPTSRTVTEISPITPCLEYTAAKRYLEQLATNLTSATGPKKGNAIPRSDRERSRNRQVINRHQLEVLANAGERKETDEIKKEDIEQLKDYEDKTEARLKQIISFHYTLTPGVKNKDDQLNDGQTRVTLPRHESSFSVNQEHVTNRKRKDDDDKQLPVHKFLSENEDRDGVISDGALQALTATDKGRAGGELWRQPSEDNVERQSRMSSGQ